MKDIDILKESKYYSYLNLNDKILNDWNIFVNCTWTHLPVYKDLQIHNNLRTEKTLYVQMEYSVSFELRNADHKNFNFVLYFDKDGDCFSTKSVYYYGNFVMDFVTKMFNKESYYDYAEEMSKYDTFARHNYKIDKSDLEKLNVKFGL